MFTLIHEADPGSFPLVHDIRKDATSLALLGDATLEEVAYCTGWRSILVILKHYRKQVEDLAFTVQAAGSAVSSPGTA